MGFRKPTHLGFIAQDIHVTNLISFNYYNPCSKNNYDIKMNVYQNFRDEDIKQQLFEEALIKFWKEFLTFYYYQFNTLYFYLAPYFFEIN